MLVSHLSSKKRAWRKAFSSLTPALQSKMRQTRVMLRQLNRAPAVVLVNLAHQFTHHALQTPPYPVRIFTRVSVVDRRCWSGMYPSTQTTILLWICRNHSLPHLPRPPATATLEPEHFRRPEGKAERRFRVDRLPKEPELKEELPRWIPSSERCSVFKLCAC